MVSSEMLCRVSLVRTDVSKDLSASFIRVRRIGELGTTLDVTSSHRRENLKILHSMGDNYPLNIIQKFIRQDSKVEIGISSQRTSVASCSLCCS
jgi:hypothetical protein